MDTTTHSEDFDVRVQHPNEGYITTKKWQAKAFSYSICTSMLFSYLESWHYSVLKRREQNRRYNYVSEIHNGEQTQRIDLLFSQTLEDLEKGLNYYFSEKTISASIKQLVGLGFISLHKNPNKRYGFDKTTYFLFHPEKVNEFIKEMTLQEMSKKEEKILESLSSVSEIKTVIIPEYDKEAIYKQDKLNKKISRQKLREEREKAKKSGNHDANLRHVDEDLREQYYNNNNKNNIWIDNRENEKTRNVKKKKNVKNEKEKTTKKEIGILSDLSLLEIELLNQVESKEKTKSLKELEVSEEDLKPKTGLTKPTFKKEIKETVENTAISENKAVLDFFLPLRHYLRSRFDCNETLTLITAQNIQKLLDNPTYKELNVTPELLQRILEFTVLTENSPSYGWLNYLSYHFLKVYNKYCVFNRE